jgi:hypothetical protein
MSRHPHYGYTWGGRSGSKTIYREGGTGNACGGVAVGRCSGVARLHLILKEDGRWSLTAFPATDEHGPTRTILTGRIDPAGDIICTGMYGDDLDACALYSPVDIEAPEVTS